MPQNFTVTLPTTPVDSDGGSLNNEWRNQVVVIQLAVNSLYQYGTTAQRPTKNVYVGQMYFDTTKGFPIFIKSLNPIVWVNGAGSVE